MNNFWQRAITGAFFVSAIIGLTLFHEYSFLGLLCLICFAAMFEYYKIVLGSSLKLTSLIFTIFGLSIVCLKFWFTDHFIYIIPIVFPLLSIVVLLSGEREWKKIGYLFTGLFYIALPLLFFYVSTIRREAIQESPQMVYNPLLAINLFVLIWCSDTFAYLCGRAFGKRKLFESVSPKKTWEGFIGAIILTVVASFFLARAFGLPAKMNLLIAFCTVVFGTLGDLIESMLKREFNIKDSGNILPGHGGVLDRFDALLISLPFTTLIYHLML